MSRMISLCYVESPQKMTNGIKIMNHRADKPVKQWKKYEKFYTIFNNQR